MALTHPSWTVDTTFSGKDISTAASVYAFTAAAAAKVQFIVKATVVGNGDYIVYLTHQWLGAGTAAVVLPKTTAAAASGETVIEFVSLEIAVKATDVVNVMIDGLAGDTNVSGAIRISADNPSVFDAANDVPAVNVTMWKGSDAGSAPLKPTTAGRTLDVSATGEAQADMVLLEGSSVSQLNTAAAALNSMIEIAGLGVYRYTVLSLANLIGADGDTLKTLSDQLDDLPTDQDVRDAMKLAPTAGDPAAGSVDKHLDDILEDTGTTLPGLISAGTGTGLYSDTITVNDGDGNPLDGVLVQVATDSAFSNVVRSGYTNNLGQVTLNFDATGTYYGRAEISDFNVSTFTVTIS